MLSQVRRRHRSQAWIVSLAWEPRQMNNAIELVYLDGDTNYFGPNFGNASIHTVARRGYRQDCPNAGRLFTQMIFEGPLEHAIIAGVAAGSAPRAAALRQLRMNTRAGVVLLAIVLDRIMQSFGRPADEHRDV